MHDWLRHTVDSYWSEVLGLRVDELALPGVRVIADAPGFEGYEGIYLLSLGSACFVATPSGLAARVAGLVEGRDVDEVFDPEFAVVLAVGRAHRVLGPSWHGYADAVTLTPVVASDVRRLTFDDLPALERLRASTPPEEWAEGGFDPLPALTWGIFDDDELDAVGNLTEWLGSPADIGLVTRREARGRGLGSRVASSMATDPVAHGHMLRYRSLVTNAPSRQIAAKLGFVGYGRNIAVRLSG